MPSPRPFRSFSRPPRRPDDRRELLELYRISLDEYRFQVTLNWSRTQYYLVLNLGVLGLATGALQVDQSGLGRLIAAGLYVVGAACAGLSIAAGAVQHEYYRATRSQKATLERRLGLGELAITTTPGMRTPDQRRWRHRLARVTTFNTVILVSIGALDLAGAVHTALWSSGG